MLSGKNHHWHRYLTSNLFRSLDKSSYSILFYSNPNLHDNRKISNFVFKFPGNFLKSTTVNGKDILTVNRQAKPIAGLSPNNSEPDILLVEKVEKKTNSVSQQIQHNNQNENSHRKRFFYSNCMSSPIFKRIQIIIGSFVTLYTGYIGYHFYASNFDLNRAILRIKVQQWKGLLWLLGEEQHSTLAEKNSQYNSWLSPEMSSLLSVYFLQLDLDKENGVRRSDICAFLQNCGLTNLEELNPVQEFLKRGFGRTNDIKKRSGCQLQEVIELFENLILHDRLHSIPVELKGTDICQLEDIFLEALRKQSKGATPNILPFSSSNFISEMTSLPINIATQDESLEISEESILREDISRLNRMKDTLLVLDERNQLSLAQKARLRNIEENIQQLEYVLATIDVKKTVETHVKALS